MAGSRRDLEQFVAEPLVRVLLELDGQAVVRPYSTLTLGTADQQSVVVEMYAVTYGSGSERKTFFVNLTLERSTQRGIRNRGLAGGEVGGRR